MSHFATQTDLLILRGVAGSPGASLSPDVRAALVRCARTVEQALTRRELDDTAEVAPEVERPR